MRKCLILIILLSCLHVATRGQTVPEVDLTGLPQPTQAKALRYWFDDDGSGVKTINQLSDTQTFDVSALLDGLHTIHYQLIDSKDNACAISSCVFIKMGAVEGSSALSLRCWFDDDVNSVKTVSSTSGIYTLDVSTLTEGLHTVHYQVIGSDGKANFIASSIFMKMKSSDGALAASKLYYWYDDETVIKQVNVSQSVQTLDASMLNVGLHTLHYQVLCNNGDLTPVISSIFMRVNFDSSTTTAKSLRYWFDDNHASLKVTDVSNGTHNIDVTDLLTGLHILHYQLVDDQGNVGTPVSCIFMKDFYKVVPDGQNRITQYQYWINNNSNAMNTVDLSNASNPYQLISLIPVQKESINSQLFHFEVIDGQPVVYAKNLFNIRFHDAKGYFTDEHHTFIDYSVKQLVNDAQNLNWNSRETIARPGENDIKWFKFNAERGDTVAFRTNQATSLQVFDPEGKEVYTAEGSASVTYGGCHTWTAGTYYVALHDVTGSGPNISLELMHMDKYDVVRQDVDVVGNGGVSTITFDGNGFKDLYAVSLYNAQGDSIKAEAIGFQNDATVSITFDFTNASLGVYDAVFHFTEESKKFKNIATVEEAKDIELELDVKYPSTFLRGTSTTYTITVTNKGNSTAYDVPMEIYLSAGDSISNISSVIFKDENGKQFNYLTLDNIEEEKDSIDEEYLNFTEELLKELNGLQTFVTVNDSTDGGEYGFTNLYFTISPNSSTTFHIEIISSETVKMNVKIPSEWFTVHPEIDVAKARMKRKKIVFGDPLFGDFCCFKEGVECTSEIIANIVGFLPGYAGCIASLGDNVLYYAFEFGCAEGDSFGERWNSFRRNMSNNSNKNWSKFWNTILSCATGGIGKWLKGKKNDLKKFEAIRDKSWQNMEHYRGQANVNRELSESAWKKFNDAVNSGDMDLAKKLKNQAQEFEVNAAEYEKLADGAYGNWLEYTAKASNLETEIGKPREGLLLFFEVIKTGIESSECVRAWTRNNSDCPPNPQNGGGSSSPANSYDPNYMQGYVAESGSKAIKEGLTDVWYTIQFENDTVFADAPAHDIYLTDTLDVNLFDFSTYRPTKITIGDKSMELTGERNFISTMDMRPEISAIAQIEGTIDDKSGIVRWHISSLDPMTMEPIKDAMIGVLPPNYGGSGLGEASFDISLKKNLPHGTVIPNRSGNIFDNNVTVLTSTWTNVIDKVPPQGQVIDVEQIDNETASVSIKATDELSGCYRYDVYVQYGQGSAWFKAAENVRIDTTASVKIYDGIDHGFYVVVTDSAGNVEQKEAAREFTLIIGDAQVTLGDANNDGKVDAADIVAVINYIDDKSVKGFVFEKADYNGDGKITIADAEGIANKILSMSQNSSPSRSRGPE